MSDHYRQHPSGIEAIELCKHENFSRGNILKYLLRAPYKGCELEDLEKARYYLDMEIERVKGLVVPGKPQSVSDFLKTWNPIQDPIQCPTPEEQEVIEHLQKENRELPPETRV